MDAYPRSLKLALKFPVPFLEIPCSETPTLGRSPMERAETAVFVDECRISREIFSLYLNEAKFSPQFAFSAAIPARQGHVIQYLKGSYHHRTGDRGFTRCPTCLPGLIF